MNNSKRKRRQTILICTMLLCLTVLIVSIYTAATTENYVNGQSAPSSRVNMPECNNANGTAQTLTFQQLVALSNDYLLLVNYQHAVPSYIAGELVSIHGHVWTLDHSILLNSHVLARLQVMFDSAYSAGFTQFRVTQGFRTHETQQYLYNQMLGTGLAAPPGHSEHQVGFAVDISYHGVNIGNSVQGTWLMNYSYRYGFILRYPAHKTDITNVPFEPWHYRYVGQPHAYFMTRNDIVLEEYIAYLQDNRIITVRINGVNFTVQYLSCTNDTITIPAGYSFMASRDNTGGVIVTHWRG